MAPRSRPRGPAGLGAAGRRLWRAILDDSELQWPASALAVVGQACRTADSIAAIESALDDAPLVVDGSRGQRVAHPLLSELRLQRQLLGSLLGRLAIAPAEDDGTPGEWDGLSASERARKASGRRWNRGGDRR